MTATFQQQWQRTFASMQRLRPTIEARAHNANGVYGVNLAHQWRLALTNLLSL
ncbi:hypothetical protein [Thiothrix winogradskyi]|uniref:Uncharacterized protein n=1 Tax=Thiothrix winogradskyi TaxID=96472 RepID=A0ABY3SXM5_9GAMM|nr:hypothetical protein [Thiothrix winogradskyi]UJS23898.1 hypothetical protein L2Y54_18450 [Thiothrix winogradskyi]